MITENNIHVHEMIGLKSEIVKSNNTEILGLNGTIINETKNMFTLDTKSGIKNIPKDHNIWKISFNHKEKEIDGSTLLKRPHERLGRKL